MAQYPSRLHNLVPVAHTLPMCLMDAWRCVTEPIVTSVHVRCERSTWSDGYFRARLAGADGSQRELSDEGTRAPGGKLAGIIYLYH